MTQQSYNLIVKILQIGAPALSSELIDELNDVINENKELKSKIETEQEEK